VLRSYRPRRKVAASSSSSQVLNKAPDVLADPSLQRIKPIRTQEWNLVRDRDILRHGVISSGDANCRVLRCELGDYATFKFPPPVRRDRHVGKFYIFRHRICVDNQVVSGR
jgi:hypothetical protein